MKANSQILITDVTFITREFCNLFEGCEHEVIYKDIKLLDGEKLNNYTTIICCKKEDVDNAMSEIDSFNGKNKEDFSINNNYCHIATFENNDRRLGNISFDEKEDCKIHANYNDNYKYLENFFNSFIRFRNNLIHNNQLVKDDDIHQYFYIIKSELENKNNKRFFKKIKEKIKRTR